MPNKQDIAAGTFFSGDSLLLEFAIQNPNGSVRDITGATVIYVIARSQGKAPILNKAVTITDGPNGECEVQLDPVDTDTLGGTYYHEVQVTDSSGAISTVIYGSFVIEKDSAP